MDINNILKKSIEFGKDFKENLPFGDNEEKYNKEFWNFITKVIKNENKEIDYEGNKFIAVKNPEHSYADGIYTVTSIRPLNSEIKISFVNDTGKEFSFETKKFRITCNEKSFIFVKSIDKNLLEQFIISNSAEEVNYLASTGINKIKFIILKTGILINKLFSEFINSPETFENFIEKLWEQLSEPFKISFILFENDNLNFEPLKKSFVSKVEAVQVPDNKKSFNNIEEYENNKDKIETDEKNIEIKQDKSLIDNVADKFKNIFKKWKENRKWKIILLTKCF